MHIRTATYWTFVTSEPKLVQSEGDSVDRSGAERHQGEAVVLRGGA